MIWGSETTAPNELLKARFIECCRFQTDLKSYKRSICFGLFDHCTDKRGKIGVYFVVDKKFSKFLVRNIQLWSGSPNLSHWKLNLNPPPGPCRSARKLSGMPMLVRCTPVLVQFRKHLSKAAKQPRAVAQKGIKRSAKQSIPSLYYSRISATCILFLWLLPVAKPPNLDSRPCFVSVSFTLISIDGLVTVIDLYGVIRLNTLIWIILTQLTVIDWSLEADDSLQSYFIEEPSIVLVSRSFCAVPILPPAVQFIPCQRSRSLMPHPRLDSSKMWHAGGSYRLPKSFRPTNTRRTESGLMTNLLLLGIEEIQVRR